MSEALYLLTGVARLVQGDCFVPQTTDRETGQLLVHKTTGQPAPRYFVGLAIPKGPEWDQLWAQITAKGMQDVPQQAGLADFKWKVVDGDAAEYAGREGFAGCYILKCTSGFPADIYDNSTPPQQIVDSNAIKRGYYVQAYINVKGHAGQSPGMYISASMIQLVGYGAEINSGPTAGEVFATPAALPAGVSAVPLAPTPIAAPVQQAAPIGTMPPSPPVAAAAPVGAGVPPVVQPIPGTVVGGALPPVAPVAAPPMPGVPVVAPQPAPAAPGYLDPNPNQ